MWVPCDQKAIFRTRLVKKLTLVSLLVLACVCFASYTSPEEKSEKRTSLWIQLFRERLSSKVHATIPQSNVGGFEFTVPQRNFKEGQEKAWTNVCECQRKMSKVVRQLQCQEQCTDHIPYYLSRLSRAHFFPTTILEIAVFALSAFGGVKNKRCRHFQRNELLLFYTVKKITLPGDL